MIRLPSLYESFWVDELHTAWSIWGDLGDVAPRAAKGNQTPLYFQLMWFWKAVVGESELALRMSSVLAVAVASVLLLFGVRQSTGSLPAGTLSGLVLAIETNSIWFGTEFRPYAFVMLLAVVATWAAVASLKSNSTISGGNLRLIFVVAAGAAALMHPTALVTLGVLSIVASLVACCQQGLRFKIQISDFVSLILMCAIGFALYHSTLGDSWENRSRWAAFGKVTDVRMFWIKSWPWVPIAIVPAALALCGLWHRKRPDVLDSFVPVIAGLLATVTFFVASYYEWVPLWQRRYFIAALPMLAWSTGHCAVLAWPCKFDRFGWAICVLIAGLLFWQQGSWQQFQRTQTWTGPRGEDWRGAIAFVNAQRHPRDDVHIDAGLIEAQASKGINFFGIELGLSDDERAIDEEYFKLPAAGPYQIPNAHKKDCVSVANWVNLWHLADQPSPGDTVYSSWLISRSGPASLQHQCQSYWLSQFAEPNYFQFGRIWVVQMKTPNSLQLKQDAAARETWWRERSRRGVIPK